MAYEDDLRGITLPLGTDRALFNRSLVRLTRKAGFARTGCCLLFATLIVLPVTASAGADLVLEPVDATRLVGLPQHRVSWATAENDLGEVADDLPLSHLTIVLNSSAQREFKAFLAQQQDPNSPNFHRWLSPTEVGERFGASAHDIQALTSWLQSQGLHVNAVSNSRLRIDASGSAANVGAALGSRLHVYRVNGERRIAPAGVPQIPAALSTIVRSVRGLATIKEKPSHGFGTAHFVGQAAGGVNSGTSCSTSSCRHYILPADFATIYGVNPVYQQGIDGSGQTIAIIGRARVYLPDVENFQVKSGLAIKDPAIIVPPAGVDPGPAASSGGVSEDQLEATLDVTRATSVAPGATIDLVISADAPTGSGLGVAAQYVVDNRLAEIMNISFGACEASVGQSGIAFWDSLFSQAAAEGISVFVVSGDSGAAGCDAYNTTPPASQTASPNYICASSYATCVGGTELADTANPSAYWSSTAGVGLASALGYIPEGAWNEPTDGSGGPQASASGGGVSTYVPTPSWQAGFGLPGGQGRYTPDVSFSASAHNGYFACLAAAGNSCLSDATGYFQFEYFFGASAATADMAGIAALLNQKMGSPQGNLNPRLYALAATPGNGVFHDVTVSTSGVSGCNVSIPSMCNNSTPGPGGLDAGLAGYLLRPGYDEVTGLGSIDVANLLARWFASPVFAQPLQTRVTATAVEYYYADWNFYFETSFPDEIAALDGGAFGGAWKRTGQTFNVWSQANAMSSPTCRFFSTPAAFGGKSSHFYTPFPAECQDLQTNPALSAVWQLETPTAFYVALTDASGNCSTPGTIPLYRTYNNGMGGAPNHRYTTDPAIQASMISMGWVAEGNGPNVIFACVPQ